ncbi:hypothetical protein NHQ30_001342 [Ciborinia camelliae]|nr:hypothetical protein NHQ30_001342 [Ciborinia camelliae]
MFFKRLLGSALLALSLSQSVSALTLDTSDPTSIKDAAGTIAYGLMKYYTGNVTNTPETIGVLPAPYYWWEAGAMWGTMLDYYHYTGDSSYNDVTVQALTSQVGPLFDYMMPNHQKDEGNDDQAFWGFATMSAAEKNFPEPSNTGGFTWLQLTENLWNTQAARWDTSTCDGGLKWQIFSFNNGYTYKNSVSNGAFFQISARLARFTGNQTYVDWAEKVYDWTTKIGLIDSDFNTFDGADESKGCSDPDVITWTYNNAIYLYGAAVMYNHTTDSTWQSRTQGLLKASANFFTPEDIMHEIACESVNTCNNDQYSFKAYLSRFMWATTQMAPFTMNTISTYLTKSASAAASICTGDANACGTKWYVGSFDGTVGPGQQMGALEVIQGLLISSAAPPITKGETLVQSASPSVSAPSNVPTPSDVPGSSNVPGSSKVIGSSNIQAPSIESSSKTPSTEVLSAISPLTTSAPVFDTIVTITVLHSTTVSCSNSIYKNSTGWFAPTSILSSHLTTALSAPVTDLSTPATVIIPASSASSKSPTALLIDTAIQPTPTVSETSYKGNSNTSTSTTALATKATFAAAAEKNMKISGAGLVAGLLGAGLLWGL